MDILQVFHKGGLWTKGMVSVYQRMGRIMVGNEDVLDSAEHEHDTKGMAQEVEKVLALAGVELIFALAASMGLRFGFVLERLLIIQCFC